MISDKLKQEVLIIHGEINQRQREASIEAFKKGKINCLVATDVASRGLDIPMVDLVIQSEPPKELDSYIHRAGRTARAGRTGICITLYTKMTEGLLYRIENNAKIKFTKIGAPQRSDIMDASIRDIKTNIQNIHTSSVEGFKNHANDLLKEYGGEEAISRLLAYVSGQTDEMKSRSLLCGAEGFITFKIESEHPFHATTFVWSSLRKIIPQDILSKVKGMRTFKNMKGALFDVEERDATAVELAAKSEKTYNPGYVITKCDSLPELSNPDDHRNGFQVDKKRMDIFVGNLPYQCDEMKIADLIKSNGIDTTGVDIRLVKDRESGTHKGFCFLSVYDESKFSQILSMGNKSIGGRQLRVDDANKKNGGR
jgi:ATP-dependent RNA helicase DDX21